jgi:o-succinylbenzoate synthase
VRIAAARVTQVRLRFARPVRTAQGEFIARDSVLLELRDDDGFAGYGEAAPWPGFGTETVEDAASRLRELTALLRGLDLEPDRWHDVLGGSLNGAPAARAAVDGALWDLAARRAGRPLCQELARSCGLAADSVLKQVPVHALLVVREPEVVVREATQARAAGFAAVKLKLGALRLADDVARMRAAREGGGPGLALRGDANGAWTLAEARMALQALAEFGLEYVEQPVPAEALHALAELRRLGLVRIAADESVATLQGAQRLIEAAAADVVVLKPASLGGPARALEIAVRARSAGIGVVFSHTFESAIGARHALHCAAAWGDATAVHGLCTAGLFADDVAEPVSCRDGFAAVGAAPGLGISL